MPITIAAAIGGISGEIVVFTVLGGAIFYVGAAGIAAKIAGKMACKKDPAGKFCRNMKGMDAKIINTSAKYGRKNGMSVHAAVKKVFKVFKKKKKKKPNQPEAPRTDDVPAPVAPALL